MKRMILLVCLMMIGSFLLGCGDDAESGIHSQAGRKPDDKGEQAVREHLKSTLIDYDSFQSMTWSDLELRSAGSISGDMTEFWSVDIKYRTRNKNGAYRIVEQRFLIRDDKVVHVYEMSDLEAFYAWGTATIEELRRLEMYDPDSDEWKEGMSLWRLKAGTKIYIFNNKFNLDYCPPARFDFQAIRKEWEKQRNKSNKR